MNARHAQLGMALALGLGVVAGRAQAQLPGQPIPPSPYAGPAVVDPGWFAPSLGKVCSPLVVAGERCDNCLNRHGFNCYSLHTFPTCSSVRSEFIFIFGSCRAFYGEPCLRRPPLVPVPPGYEPFRYSPR
jgi:hypothetical protein